MYRGDAGNRRRPRTLEGLIPIGFRSYEVTGPFPPRTIVHHEQTFSQENAASFWDSRRQKSQFRNDSQYTDRATSRHVETQTVKNETNQSSLPKISEGNGSVQPLYVRTTGTFLFNF